jgi:hypothetical protein
LKKFKTRKKLYTRPLFITDSEYRFHNQEIQSFSQLLPQSDVLIIKTKANILEF